MQYDSLYMISHHYFIVSYHEWKLDTHDYSTAMMHWQCNLYGGS